MRKPGTDENNVQMSDVLCDFCGAAWSDDLPMIEGHHGSCLCGKCLTVAYTGVVLNEDNSAPVGYHCAMCLEQRQEPAWQSPLHPEAVVCRRCVRMAATALEKTEDHAWRKPAG